MWVLVIIGFLAIVFFTGFIFEQKRVKVLPTPLSPPAAMLVKEYNALPDDVKPFENILTIVQGLDAKTAVDKDDRYNHFNDHFHDYSNTVYLSLGYKFTWKKNYGCTHAANYCRFSEYANLHKVIEEVAESVKAKQRAILESQYSGDAPLIKELEESLRAEAGINKTFVKRFKELA